MNTPIQGFVSPDHHRTNGFARTYVEDQLDGVSDRDGLQELREELVDIVSIDPEWDIIDIRSPWLLKQLGQYGVKNISELLTFKHDYGYIVDDRTFENVLQAHQYEIARKSNEMKPLFNQHVEEFRDRVGELVSTGVLPERVIDELVKLDGIGFAIGDATAHPSMLAQVETGMNSSLPADVLVYQAAIDRPDALKATIFHELVHVIGLESAFANISKLLKQTLPDPRAAYDIARDIEEGLTEHIAQVITGTRTMDDTTIDPKETLIYITERRFLHVLASHEAAQGNVMQDLVNIYFGQEPEDSQVKNLAGILQGRDVPISSFFLLQDYDRQDRIFAAASVTKKSLD